TENVLQFLPVELVASRAAHPAGHVAEQLLDQRADVRLDLAVEQIRSDKSNAAIYIITYSAGRNYAALGGVGGGDAADAEAVAPVDVRHRQAGVLDARQEGDVGHLLRRLVEADLLKQVLVGEDQAV